MARLVGSGTVRRSDVIRVFALVLVDIFALYEAFMIAYIQRASDAKPLAHNVSAYGFSVQVAAIAPMWALIFAGCGLYSHRVLAHRAAEAFRVVCAVSGGVISLIVWQYLSPGTIFFPSRAIPLWATADGVVLVLVGRFFIRRLVRMCFRRGLGLHHVVLVGAGDLASQVAHEMGNHDSGYRIVASVDPRLGRHQLQSPATPVFGTLEAVVNAKVARIDEVMQADSDLSSGEITQMMTLATSRGIGYRFVPDQYGMYAAASTVTAVGAIPVLELRLTALGGWGAVGKRAFDLVGAAALILLFSPFLIALTIIVKLNDRSGPVFYRHARLGRNGRSIQVLKFRSMSWAYSTGPDRPYKTAGEAFTAMGRDDLCAEFETNHKVNDDPRVSRLGNFLRSTSLDELPQLLNVAAGDLSMVGPRPITAGELERYGGQHATFLALKPGITGLWQVSGRSATTYTERVDLDVFYIEHWSLGLDLRILYRTVRTVTARRGAC